ncbi:2-polyprenyl-3-methyl-5-hydroxy-6-metoxy-1,4-benzoquinol methylase [Sphingomonas sp. F9_3S_D5_B_2]
MATPGQIARRLLGPYFRPVGDAYRRVFVDLAKIAEALNAAIPQGARILDIGGGDGALIDRVLDRRPDLTVTMCDVAPIIGSFLSDANRSRVTLFPATDFTEIDGDFDFVMITDVMHHVAVEHREPFFAALAQSCQRWGCRTLFFKDVEPGSFRATLSLLADLYITGDKHVVLFSRAEFYSMSERYFPIAERVSAMPDSPNYCETLSW